MHWLTRSGWIGNSLTLVAGALITLTLAPFDLWPLTFVACIILYLGLRKLNPSRADILD